MKPIHRVIGGFLAVAVLVVVAIAYSAHAVRSSDHQDTYNLATRSNTSADITDVYVFPSPANSANVVFVMNVSPLIPAGMGTAKFFDPTLMWQFKISHGTSGVEDRGHPARRQRHDREPGHQRLRSGANRTKSAPRTRSSRQPAASPTTRRRRSRTAFRSLPARAPIRSSSTCSRSSRSSATATTRPTPRRAIRAPATR